MLKLYHFWSSTCSRRVRLCLAEKGLEWDSRHVDLGAKFEHLTDWYLKINPGGVVPTLDHDGRLVVESNVILEYLDESFPQVPLRPTEPFARARMRIWMDKFEHVVHRNINLISFNRRFRPRIEKYPPEERQALIAKVPDAERRAALLRRMRHGVSADEEAFAEQCLAAIMDEMEQSLARGPWLLGDEISLADLSIAPFLERFAVNGLDALIDFRARPALGDWWARMQARPCYIETYAFTNPDEE